MWENESRLKETTVHRTIITFLAVWKTAAVVIEGNVDPFHFRIESDKLHPSSIRQIMINNLFLSLFGSNLKFIWSSVSEDYGRLACLTAPTLISLKFNIISLMIKLLSNKIAICNLLCFFSNFDPWDQFNIL